MVNTLKVHRGPHCLMRYHRDNAQFEPPCRMMSWAQPRTLDKYLTLLLMPLILKPNSKSQHLKPDSSPDSDPNHAQHQQGSHKFSPLPRSPNARQRQLSVQQITRVLHTTPDNVLDALHNTPQMGGMQLLSRPGIVYPSSPGTVLPGGAMPKLYR